MRHWGNGHGVGALPGVYRRSADRSPAFIEAVSHTDDELHELVQSVIKRLMKLLTYQGVLVEDMGRVSTYEVHQVLREALRETDQ